MTRKERYLAAMRGQKPDRLPLSVGSHDGFVRQYYGIPARRLVDDPEVNARATIRFVEEFGVCATPPASAYIFFGCGPETGIRWEFVEDGLPAATEGLIHDRVNLDLWQPPREPEGYFRRYLDIAGLVRDEVGDRVFLIGTVAGPFTITGFLRGIEQALLDTRLDPDLYRSIAAKCVGYSCFLGEHVLSLGLPSNVLNDIFVVPEMVSPSFYYDYVAPYNQRVLERLSGRPAPIAHTASAFMGKQNDPASQREAQYVFHYYFGTRESLDAIKLGMQCVVPGYPGLVALSGRMMATWSREQVLDFLQRALDYVIGEQGKYPCVRVVTAQPTDRAAALDFADKLRAIDRFLDELRL